MVAFPKKNVLKYWFHYHFKSLWYPFANRESFSRSSFSEFSQKNAKEERYRAIEKVRERESLFNEYIVEVRRREKEDKQLKKEQVGLGYARAPNPITLRISMFKHKCIYLYIYLTYLYAKRIYIMWLIFC